jgi:hypothetical protein
MANVANAGLREERIMNRLILKIGAWRLAPSLAMSLAAAFTETVGINVWVPQE